MSVGPHIARSMFIQQHLHTGENLFAQFISKNQKQTALKIPPWLRSLVQNCLQESYKYFPACGYKQVVAVLANTKSTRQGHSLCVIQVKTVLVVRLTLQPYRKPIGQEVEKQDKVRSDLFPPPHTHETCPVDILCL